MCPQAACIRGCKVTLVAFVWLFSTVRFQMRLQTACLRRCIVTLVAFVWLFCTVCFQMYLQIACPTGCIITLAAIIWPDAFLCLLISDIWKTYIPQAFFHHHNVTCTVFRLMETEINFWKWVCIGKCIGRMKWKVKYLNSIFLCCHNVYSPLTF